jgi:putative flippase GtrA
MGKAALDPSEFARFVVTGVAAACANLAAVWLARFYASFEISLLAGIVTGLVVSFTLSKWFAFRSHSWQRTGGEASRFLVVYALSSATYWAVAMIVGHFVLAPILSTTAAEMAGILAGAAMMTLTSYLGHRLFTYRTYQNGPNRLGRVS